MRRGLGLFAIALVVTALIATVVSQLGSSEPDGLEFVAEQQGFGDTATENPAARSPLAGYGGSGRNLAVAGLVGVALTLAIGWGVFWMVRSGSSDPDPSEPTGA